MRFLLIASIAVAFVAACGGGNDSNDGIRDAPGIYIALGDSLSEGVGASDRDATAFVPLVHEGLGDGFQLMNLGHSGDTSEQLISHGHLDEALTEIDRRNGDDDDANDVRLVTLEIGGNDLLDLYFSLVLTGGCVSMQQALEKPECVDALRGQLDAFRPNLDTALDRLTAADPDLTVVVMTLYDPFSGGLEAISELAELALEGMPDTPFEEGLNDVIRDEAAGRDVVVVDWFPLFEGRAGDYISRDLIHPNDRGHEVMADAILQAVR